MSKSATKLTPPPVFVTYIDDNPTCFNDIKQQILCHFSFSLTLCNKMLKKYTITLNQLTFYNFIQNKDPGVVLKHVIQIRFFPLCYQALNVSQQMLTISANCSFETD